MYSRNITVPFTIRPGLARFGFLKSPVFFFQARKLISFAKSLYCHNSQLLGGGGGGGGCGSGVGGGGGVVVVVVVVTAFVRMAVVIVVGAL